MLEARIQSPKGSLYFAAEATACDLEMLQHHVRDLTPRAKGVVKLEVAMDDHDPAAPAVADWLCQLAASGVRIARGLTPAR